MSHPVVNPANAVTALRYPCLPLFLYVYDQGWIQLAVLTVIVSGVLDKLDGPVARLCKCQSAFGEFFDGITDAISYGFFLCVALAYGAVSALPIAIILVLFTINSVFRVIYARRVGKATNYFSHAMVRVVGYIAFMAGMIVVGFEPEWFAWGGVILTSVVVIYDAKRMLIDPVPA